MSTAEERRIQNNMGELGLTREQVLRHDRLMKMAPKTWPASLLAHMNSLGWVPCGQVVADEVAKWIRANPEAT
jgi:hypothetical protein